MTPDEIRAASLQLSDIGYALNNAIRASAPMLKGRLYLLCWDDLDALKSELTRWDSKKHKWSVR